jgi:hypothetical protein
MIRKAQIGILGVVSALIGAVLIGTVAHDLMGVPRALIREEALAGAAMLGIVCAAQTLLRRHR